MYITIWYSILLLCIRWEHLIRHLSRESTNTHDLPVIYITIWYVKERPLTLCLGLVLLCIRWEHLIWHSSWISTNTHDLPVMDITIWYVKERPLTLCRGLVLLCFRWEHLIWHSSRESTNTHDLPVIYITIWYVEGASSDFLSRTNNTLHSMGTSHLTFVEEKVPISWPSSHGHHHLVCQGTSSDFMSGTSTTLLSMGTSHLTFVMDKYQYTRPSVMDITIWYVMERTLILCRGLVLLCIWWEHLIWHSSWISTNTHDLPSWAYPFGISRNVLWLYVADHNQLVCQGTSSDFMSGTSTTLYLMGTSRSTSSRESTNLHDLPSHRHHQLICQGTSSDFISWTSTTLDSLWSISFDIHQEYVSKYHFVFAVEHFNQHSSWKTTNLHDDLPVLKTTIWL
jgi:hypothetical protein